MSETDMLNSGLPVYRVVKRGAKIKENLSAVKSGRINE